MGSMKGASTRCLTCYTLIWWRLTWTWVPWNLRSPGLWSDEYANYQPIQGSATLDFVQFRKYLDYVKQSRAPTNVDEAVVGSCVMAWGSNLRVWGQRTHILPAKYGFPKSGETPSQLPKIWGNPFPKSGEALYLSLKMPFLLHSNLLADASIYDGVGGIWVALQQKKCVRCPGLSLWCWRFWIFWRLWEVWKHFLLLSCVYQLTPHFLLNIRSLGKLMTSSTRLLVCLLNGF